MKKKIVAGIVGVGMFGGALMGVAAPAFADEVVAIPDETLRDCLLESLKDSHIPVADPARITDAELEKLRSFSCYNRPDARIKDFTGIERATSLSRVYLSGVEIDTADPSPLAQLPALEELSLSATKNTDVSQLAVLTQLKSLRLANNEQLTDVSGLAALTRLERLEMTGNRVADLSPLAGLTHLKRLDLTGNRVADVSSLAELPELSVLVLDKNGISDLSTFAGLTVVKGLYLRDNQIADLSPLAGLTGLQVLDLDSNQVVDVSPLAGLTRLQVLELYRNQVVDVSPLAGLTGLLSLGLDRNQVVDVSPLAGLTGLVALGLYANNVVDVSPLASLVNYFTLNLADNKIADASPLADLAALDGTQHPTYSHQKRQLVLVWQHVDGPVAYVPVGASSYVGAAAKIVGADGSRASEETATWSEITAGAESLAKKYGSPATAAEVTHPVVWSELIADPAPAAVVGTRYAHSFSVTEGFPVKSFSIEGTVPGLTMASNGRLSGTPKESGVFPVTVKAVDGYGNQMARTYELSVSAESAGADGVSDPGGAAGSNDAGAAPGKVSAQVAGNLSLTGGADMTPGVLGGIGALVAGAVLWFVMRRRRSTRAES